jgi:hypothetical protein
MKLAIVTFIVLLLLTHSPIVALVAAGMAWLVAETDGNADELGEPNEQ